MNMDALIRCKMEENAETVMLSTQKTHFNSNTMLCPLSLSYTELPLCASVFVSTFLAISISRRAMTHPFVCQFTLMWTKNDMIKGIHIEMINVNLE